jgi:hypothetical protein
MRKRTTCLLVGALASLIVGAILFGGSWLAQYEMQQFIRTSIIKQVVVDSPNAPGYPTWQSTFSKDAPTLYQSFSFFNVTNLDAVLQGALPIVEEVGPYVYWFQKELIDVNFTDNGNKVEYNPWQRFVFLPDLSPGLNESDVIVSINPAYIGAVAQAGGESYLSVGLTGPCIKLVFDFLWTTFTWDIVAQAVPSTLGAAQKALMAKVNDTVFYATWANATKPPSDDWKGMIVSFNSSIPSGISIAAAKALFDPILPLSLLNTSLAATRTWRRALYDGPENAAFGELSETFELSAGQMSMLLQWLNCSFYPVMVYPDLTSTWNVSEISDLAFVQWGTGAITGGVSITTLYEGLPFPATPEYATFWRRWNPFSTIDPTASKILLEGPYGLFDAQNVALFFGYVEAGNFTAIHQVWDLNMAEAVSFVGYFFYMREEYSLGVLEHIVQSGGGLYVARTVHQWLWKMDDPLLLLLAPTSPSGALIGNETTPDDARKKHPPSTVYTGKENINQVQVYTVWQGVDTIKGVYAVDVPVGGVNDIGLFQPFINENTILWSWDSNYIRNMRLVPTGYVSHRGIKTIRYEIDNQTFAVNSDLYQTIQGFANLTGAHNSSSIFLSNPHMFGADPKYTQMIEGQVQNFTIDITIIDIEPNLGQVLNLNEGLQINVYLDPHKSYMPMSTFYPNVRLDVFHPIVYVKQYVTLTDKNAQQIKDSLYLGLLLKDVLFWTSLAVGACLLLTFVPCSLVAFRYWWKDRTADQYPNYVVINE